MTDSTDHDLDMRAFCAAVLREYEEVIATIIQRPVRAAETGPGDASGPAEAA